MHISPGLCCLSASHYGAHHNGVHGELCIKGAVSYRFSQGLLTLMCNNSKLKVDINFFFFLLRRQTSKVYNWLQKFTIPHPVAML